MRLGGAGPPAPVSVAPAPGCDASASPEWCDSRRARISRHSFHATHSSTRPPASSSPTIWRSCTVTAANPTRIRVAATMPSAMTRARSFAGSPAATMPTTIALSPASTRSTMMTCSRALASAAEIMGDGSGGRAAASVADRARCSVASGRDFGLVACKLPARELQERGSSRLSRRFAAADQGRFTLPFDLNLGGYRRAVNSPWIPAFAGMTDGAPAVDVSGAPADVIREHPWIPAFAGMTAMAFGATPCRVIIPAFAGMTAETHVMSFPRKRG